jgi:hypothetical protein
MTVNCQEHRKSMELLSLKMQVEKGLADPETLDEILKRIALLEEELELD